jgi:hypothetical protein
MPKSGPFIANPVKGSLTFFLATLGKEKILFVVSYMVGSSSSFPSQEVTSVLGLQNTSRKWPFCNWSLRLIFSYKRHLQLKS